ncbi:DUF2617 family protein [Corynebacterium suicordis]
MSISRLAIAPQDIHSESLGVRLDGPAPAMLADARVHAPGARLQLTLGILGASHVVDATPANTQLPTSFREEISCHALEGGMALGDGVEKNQRWGAGNYRLTARRVTYSPEEFAEQAERILREAESESWLVGTFPGEGKYHLTALWGKVEGERAQWRTWHFYPAELAVVESESELTVEENEVGEP